MAGEACLEGLEIGQICNVDGPEEDCWERMVALVDPKKQDAALLRVETIEAVLELARSSWTILEVALQPQHLEVFASAIKSSDRKGQVCQTLFLVEGFHLCEVSKIHKESNEGLAFAKLTRPPVTALADLPTLADVGAPIRILVLDGLTDAANVGACVRMAVAFGAAAVLCSKNCCDAFNAKAIRASTGLVFRTPIVSGSLPELLAELRGLSVFTAAAIVQPGSRYLDEVERLPNRWALIVGSEHHGVSNAARQASDLLLKVRMAEGVDSLNVMVSAGVLLHGCFEREASGLTAPVYRSEA